MQKIKKEQPVEVKSHVVKEIMGVSVSGKLQKIPMNRRPTVEFEGYDSNISNLVDAVCKTLRKSGYKLHAKEVEDRCNKVYDYDEALNIFTDYVIVDS